MFISHKKHTLVMWALNFFMYSELLCSVFCPTWAVYMPPESASRSLTEYTDYWTRQSDVNVTDQAICMAPSCFSDGSSIY